MHQSLKFFSLLNYSFILRKHVLTRGITVWFDLDMLASIDQPYRGNIEGRVKLGYNEQCATVHITVNIYMQWGIDSRKLALKFRLIRPANQGSQNQKRTLSEYVVEHISLTKYWNLELWNYGVSLSGMGMNFPDSETSKIPDRFCPDNETPLY